MRLFAQQIRSKLLIYRFFRQMISLAHHSYIAMVHEADKTEDAVKLATWWNKFLGTS